MMLAGKNLRGLMSAAELLSGTHIADRRMKL
jgi:hypothetical protein